MSEVTIQFAEEQQKQIKNAAGKDMTELNLSFGSQGVRSGSELSGMPGGVFRWSRDNGTVGTGLASPSNTNITG